MKSLKKFEFKATSNSVYPWVKILDGGTYELTKGEDYLVETSAMGPKIKTAARKRYLNVKIQTLTKDDKVVCQAYPMTDDDKQIEDAKRAEEKAWTVQNNAKKKARRAIA